MTNFDSKDCCMEQRTSLQLNSAPTVRKRRRQPPRAGDVWRWHAYSQPEVYYIFEVDGDKVLALCVEKPGYAARCFSVKCDFTGENWYAKKWELVSRVRQPKGDKLMTSTEGA